MKSLKNKRKKTCSLKKNTFYGIIDEKKIYSSSSFSLNSILYNVSKKKLSKNPSTAKIPKIVGRSFLYYAFGIK